MKDFFIPARLCLVSSVFINKKPLDQVQEHTVMSIFLPEDFCLGSICNPFPFNVRLIGSSRECDATHKMHKHESMGLLFNLLGI